MVGASREAMLPSIHCTIHLLQLCVKDAIFEQESIKEFIAKCRRLYGHFSHSSSATATFFKIQDDLGMPMQLRLVQDVTTRWNSTYLMLERLLRLKRPVQIYLGEHERLNLTITASELQVAELIVDILKPFFAITKSMSSEVASVSVVIPSILTLQKYVQRREDPEGEIAATKQKVLSAVEKRFFNENDNHLKISVTYSQQFLTRDLGTHFYRMHSKMQNSL